MATAIAIAAGILVLVGYFINYSVLTYLRTELLDWAIILAAFAVLVGIFNLLIVHGSKAFKRQKGRSYSALLIVFMVATFLYGLARGPEDPNMVSVFTAIQLPVEASLMALLAVTLIYASIRLLRRRLGLVSVIFVVTIVLILFGAAPLPLLGYLPFLSNDVRPIVAQVLAAGGARGILIGVALGALTTGLRILFGGDRPYKGS